MVAALYRRYRPEAFAEMIGQSQVTEPLMTALRSGRIGHAYLFSGPRGCGKTTSARILARCLNCAQGPTDTPCGECPSCLELSRDGGGSLDVVEIDAASHGGVDDARDLRERAAFAPARDNFKIFIIDEAHMVTPAGFNALLKIVEEPPPHVKFVFATTEPEKVIGTIRSRTHHYPFRLIAPGTLVEYVQTLIDSEGVQVEPGVLPLVVRAGGGSVRDTLSILDQLIAGSEGDSVTTERAAGLLGFTHSELLDDVVAAFGARDSAAAFRATDRVVQTGQDPRRFVEDLLERLRDLIVVGATTVDGAAAVFRGVPQDQLTRMFEQAQSFGPGELSRIADVVSAALDKMAGATAPRLQLELMIARVLVGIGAVGEPRRGAPAVASGSAPVAPQAQAQAQAPSQSQSQSQPQAQAQAPSESQSQVSAAPTSVAAPAPAATAARVPETAPAAKPNAAEPDVVKPNAAQTAASIREFLREESSDAAAHPQANTPAPEAPATEGLPSDAPALDEPSRQAHPNEGAAKFGRPISEVLSPSQIASIGSESAGPRPAAAADNTVTDTAATGAGSVGNRAVDTGQSDSAQAQGSPQSSATEASGATPDNAASVAVASAAPAAQDAAGADRAVHSDDGSGLEYADTAGGFEDLLELWPDLLDELLERDRDAWNAVRGVQPLALDGDLLSIGIANQSDLAAFKNAGAGPLRETILAAVGVSVRYVPKRVQGAGADSSAGSGAQGVDGSRDTSREGSSGGSRESGGESARGSNADSEEPHRAGSNPNLGPAVQPSEVADDAVKRAEERLNGLGPALAAPAWADLPDEEAAVEEPAVEATGVRALDAEYGEVEEPPGEDPYRGASDGTDPDVAGPPSSDGPVSATGGRTDAEPMGDESSAAGEQPPARSAPKFTRYGEAVVREVLGARFVEERPLPPRSEG